MLQYMKKGICSIMFLTLVTLLLSSNVSFAQVRFFAADVQGTWQMNLNRVVFTNVNRTGPPPNAEFSDTAIMKITQSEVAFGFPIGLGVSKAQIEIDGTTNSLIDEPTPTPDFRGVGAVLPMTMLFTPGFTNFNKSDNSMTAFHCDSDTGYAQHLIVHRIDGFQEIAGISQPTEMRGTWIIIDRRAGNAVGIVVEFTAAKIDPANPNVSTCP